MADATLLVAFAVILFFLLRRRRQRRLQAKKSSTRTKWVRPIFQEETRRAHGQYHNLVRELSLGDREYYFRYLRMTPQRFEHLLSLVAPLISKKSTKLRSSISAAERLTLTLRYLASGDSQQSQAFNFRIGRSTVSMIIRETCNAIWSQLREMYLPTPTNPEEWKKISEEFSTLWHFPHCIGAGDGKHVVIECPKNSGSNYFNYKGTFSIVLLAYGDANYCFTAVDVGQYGRSNDSGAFANSAFGKALESNGLNVPAAEHVQGCAEKLPYVTVVDEGLPLKPYQMRPYPGKNLTEDRAIFNYRLSRARRIIENIFGILAARWRIFRRPIRADVATVEKIVLACVCLHNYLRLTENASYAPKGFVDSEDNNGAIKSGDWRKITANDEGCFRSFQAHGGRFSYQANVVRENFKQYFLSPEGQVAWQWDYVRSCGPRRG